MVDQLFGGERLWMRSQMIVPIAKQLAGCDIEGEVELLTVADGVPCLLDGCDQFIQHQLIADKVGSKTAFVTDRGDEVARFQALFQYMIDLDPSAQCGREIIETHRSQHELLDVDGVVGVSSAVDHIHQGNRQPDRIVTSEVTVEG